MVVSVTAIPLVIVATEFCLNLLGMPVNVMSMTRCTERGLWLWAPAAYILGAATYSLNKRFEQYGVFGILWIRSEFVKKYDGLYKRGGRLNPFIFSKASPVHVLSFTGRFWSN